MKGQFVSLHLPSPLGRHGPRNRPDGQQRADDRFDVGDLGIALGDQRSARDGHDLVHEGDPNRKTPETTAAGT